MATPLSLVLPDSSRETPFLEIACRLDAGSLPLALLELCCPASSLPGTAAVALIRSWAEAYLHSSVVHDAKMHSDQLTADGPYRYVRNPLYLGTVLLALGLGTMASRFGFAIVVAGIPVIVYRLILREEAGLLASQGERYREYFRAVPRLIPALHPRVPSGEARPDWVDGFTGKRSCGA